MFRFGFGFGSRRSARPARPAAGPATPPPPFRRRPVFEALENRLLLSADPLATLANDGLLSVRLTDGADQALVERIGASAAGGDIVKITLGAITQQYGDDALGVVRLLLDAGAGDDAVRMNGLTAAAEVIGGLGTDTLLGPDGDSAWSIGARDTGVVGSVAFSSFEHLVGGDDTRDTFVFAAGAMVTGSVDGGARGFDSIVIAGGTYERVSYAASSPDSGVIDFDGDLLAYRGMEPILDATVAANKTFNATGGADQVALSDAGGGQSLLDSTNGLFEDITFLNPTTSLTINLLGGDDTLSVSSLAPAFAAALTINGDAGRDQVSFTGAVATNGGALDVQAETIAVAASATLDAGTGDLTLQASDSATSALGGADASATIDGTLRGGDVVVSATADHTVSTTGLGGFGAQVALADADATALVTVRNGAVIEAGGALTLRARTTVDATATATATASSLGADAASATVLVDATARALVAGGAALTAGTDLLVEAGNTVAATATADGSGGNAGASVAVVVVDQSTQAIVEGTAALQGANVTLKAGSTGTVKATAKSSQGGAGDNGTQGDTDAEQALDDYDAASAGSPVGLAGAVAVTDFESTTEAGVRQDGDVEADAAVLVQASSLNDVSATADGSATTGKTGVGVAVAIDVSKVDSLAFLAGTARAAGDTLTVEALLPGTNRFSASATSGAGASNVGVAGSLAINVAVTTALARIDGGANVDVDGANVTLRADSHTEATARALPTENGATGASLGIGASIAVNVATNTTRAALEDGARLANAGDLTLEAGGQHAMTTEAKGGAEGGTAVTAVAATSIATNTTAARLGTLPSGALVLTGDLTAAASQRSTVGTSAEGDAEGSSTAVGASLALSVVRDSVFAELARNTTAGGAIALTSGGASSSRSRAKAAASGAEGEGGGTPDVNTQVGNQRTEGNNQATSRGASGSGSTTTPSASTADGGGGSVTVAAAIGVNIADATSTARLGDGLTIDTGGGALTVRATGNADASAEADGSTANGGTGVGAAVALNKASASTTALIGDATVAATGVTVGAGMTDVDADRTHTFGAEATSGASADKVGVAGSLALNIEKVDTRAAIAGGAAVDAGGGDVRIEAGATSANAVKALPKENGATGESVGVGASVAINIGDHDTVASLDDNARLTGAGAITLATVARHDMATEAKGGAEGGTAVTPVVAITVANNDAVARIGAFAGDTLTLDGALEAKAELRTSSTTKAEGDAEGSKAAVGASFALTVANDSVLATTERNIDAGGAVSFLAHGASVSSAEAKASATGAEGDDGSAPDDGVDQETSRQRGHADTTAGANDAGNTGSGSSGSASTSEGGVSVAAAISVNVATTSSRAVIGDRDIDAGGTLTLSAAANTDAAAKADGSATGESSIGIGAAVAVNVANVDNEATLGAGGGVAAKGLVVEAVMNESPNDDRHTFGAEAKSGAGAGKVGVAGSVSINIVDTDTTATVAGTAAAALGGDALRVEAESRTASTSHALPEEDPTKGGKVGVGASVALNVIDNATAATVADGAALTGTAGAVTVGASAAHTVDTKAENGASGDIGVGAGVAVAVIENDTTAVLGSGGALSATGEVVVSATQTSASTMKVEAEGAGSRVGVGASVGVAVVLDEATAELRRSVSTTGGGVTVAASSTSSSAVEVKASAKGQSESGRDADGEADHQVNDNANSPGQDLNARGANAQNRSSSANGTAQSQSSTGSQGVGVAAAVGVNVVVNDAKATIADGVNVGASGAVKVSAQNETDASTKALGWSGAFGSSVNVGAAVAVNVATATNTALIGANAIVSGNGITIEAVTPDGKTNDVKAQALSGAVGKETSVAGSVAINVASFNTEASVRAGADLSSTGGATVEAGADLRLQNLAGGGAAGLNTAGVGAAIAINVVTDTTKAFVADAAIDAAGAIRVEAAATIAPVDGDIPTDPMTLAAGGGATTGNAGIGGSVIVDVFTLTTHAFIDDGAEINQGAAGGADQDVTVRASDSTHIESGAGGIGAAMGNAGIGIGVNVAVLSKDVRAFIGSGAEVSAGGDVGVLAISSEEVFTVAASAGLAGGSAGVGGSVTVQVISTGTRAYVEGGAGIAALGDVSVTADGSANLDLLAGGLAFGASVGVGIASTTLVHTDTVEAYIDAGADVASAGNPGLLVSATSSEDVQSFAVGVGASGGSAGVAASASVNVLTETTRAYVAEGVTIDATSAGASNPGIAIIASDSTILLGVAGGIAAASSAAVGAGADVGVITKDTQAWIAAGATADADGNVAVSAQSTEDLTSIAVSGGGASSAAIMGSTGVYVLTTDTRAFIGDDPEDSVTPAAPADVTAGGTVSVNASGATELDLITGNISGAGTAAIGAAAGVAVFDKNTEAFIGANSLVTGRGLLEGNAQTGQFGVGFFAPGGGSNEVGLPLIGGASRDANQDGGSDTTDQSFMQQRTVSPALQKVRGVSVGATNRDDVEAIAVSGGGAGTVAVNIGAAVVVVDAETLAFIDDGAIVNGDLAGADAAQSVLVAAGNDFYMLGVAGVGSISGTASISPGANVSVVHNTTRAHIDAGADVAARGDVVVTANAAEDLLLVSAGISLSGSVAVAGTVAVLSLNGTTEAYIGAGADVDAGGNVLVAAADASDVDAIVGSAGIGVSVAGVSGSVGVMLFNKDTRAWIADGATVDGKGNGGVLVDILDGTVGADFGRDKAFRGVAVQAESSESLLQIAASAAGGLYAGVAGGVGVTVIDSDVEAWIGNADVNLDATGASAEQSVNVSAANKTDTFTFAGAIGGGIAGVAGGVDVGSIKNDVSARILGGADVRAQNDVDVHALSIKDVEGFTFSGAGGIVGVAGSVSVWSIGAVLEKNYTDNDGNSANAAQFGAGAKESDQFAGEETTTSQSAVATPVGSYATGNTADGNDSNTERMNGGMSQAAAKLDAKKVTQTEIAAAVNAPAPPGVQAFIADGATVHAGDDIEVLAKERIDLQLVTGGAGLGLGGVGAGITVLSVASNTRASIDGVISAGDDILVKAALEETLQVTSLALGGGFVGLGAAVVVINESSTQYAFIDAGAAILAADQITVMAEADQVIDGVDALGGKMTGQGVFGGVAVGASFAKVLMDGEAHAYVGPDADVGQAAGQTVGGLEVVADVDARVDTEVFALGIGAGTISANFAFVDVRPRVEARIDVGTDIDVLRSVGVRALSAGSAEADVFTASVGGASIGASIARATLNPDIDAFVAGVVTIGAGQSIAVESRHNINGAGQANGRGARARAQAPTGGIGVGIAGTAPTATASAAVDASVANTATLTGGAGGTITIAARAYNDADAFGEADALGIATGGVGATISNATAGGASRATLNGQVLGGASLEVIAQSVQRADLDSRSVGGGLFFGAAASTGTAVVNPDIAATITGIADVDIGGSVLVSALSEADSRADVRGTSGGALEVGVAMSTSRITSGVNAKIATGADVAADGDVTVHSAHNILADGTALTKRAFANTFAPGGGVLSAKVTQSDADANATSDAVIENGAALDAGGIVSIIARNSNRAVADGRNIQGGVIAVGSVDALADAAGHTRARLEADLAGGGGLTILSQSVSFADAGAAATSGGIVAGVGSKAIANATPDVDAYIAGGLAVDLDGLILIGTDSSGSADADASGISGGIFGFGIVTAQANSAADLDAYIGSESDVRGGAGILLFSQHRAENDLGARAVASAPGGGIAAGGGASPDATAQNTADTYVAAGTTLASGGLILLRSDVENRAVADANALAIGLALGVGISDADALSHGAALARMEGTITTGGALTVEAVTENRADADADAGGGGIVGAVGAHADALVTPTAVAKVTGDANVSGLVTVRTDSITDAAADTFGGVGGLLAVGDTDSVALLRPDADAFIGANVVAGSVLVEALHNATGDGSARAVARGTGGGLLGANFINADADAIADVQAYLANGATIDAAGDITFNARSTDVASAQSLNNTFGLIGIGTSRSEAVSDATTKAFLAGDILGGGTVRMTAQSVDSASALAQATTGGLAAGAGVRAIAFVGADTDAYIDFGADVDVAGSVFLTAQSEGDADANTSGTVLAGLGIGTTFADADVASDIDTYIAGRGTIRTGGGIGLTSLHNVTSGGSNIAKGATAFATGTSGTLIGGQGATADADAAASVDTRIESGRTVDADGTVSLTSRSNNDADATARGLTIGIVAAVGAVTATADANGSTFTHLDAALVDGAGGAGGGGVSMLTDVDSTANADARAASGGLFAALSVNRAQATVLPAVQTTIGAPVHVTGGISINTNVFTDADANVDGFSVTLGLAAGTSRAIATQSPEIQTSIAGGGITADSGSISLGATHNSGTTGAIADSSGGGLIGVLGSDADAVADADMNVFIGGQAVVNAGGSVSLSARNANAAFASADGDTGGFVAVGESDANATALGDTRARLLGIASLSAGGNLNVLAVATGDATANADASSGGVVALREPRAFADVAPVVQSSVSSTGEITVGLSADIRAAGMGSASADADGTGGGVVAEGTSAATAKWRPDVRAQIGAGTDLAAGDDVRVQAFNNHDEAGNIQNFRRVRADATASGGGVVDLRGSETLSEINAYVEASIGSGADVAAGSGLTDDIDVVAKSNNRVEGLADGVGGGLFSKGSSDAQGTIRSQSLAFTADASSEDRTRLAGGGLIRLHAESNHTSDVRADGFAGGLVGLGGSEARTDVLDPVTKARLGSNNTVLSDSATFEVSAENRANLFSKTNQEVTAAIANNEARSVARIANSQTLAEVGAGATVHVDRVRISAREIDVFAKAESDTEVPFDIAGNNEANAAVIVDLNATTHVFGPNTDIKACEGIDIIAGSDRVRTVSDAYARTFGITGNVIATARNDKSVDVDVIVDSGVHLSTNNLVVNAYANNESNDVDYLKFATAQGDTVVNYVLKAVGTVTKTVCTIVGEVVCLWGLICDAEEICEEVVETVFDWVAEVLGATVITNKPGVETVTNDVTFNADVTLGCASPNPTLLIDVDNLIVEDGGFLVRDGEGRSVTQGDTVGDGPVQVDGLDVGAAGNMTISAVGGTTSGFSSIEYAGAPGVVTIINRGSQDLKINGLAPYSVGTPPKISEFARNGAALWNYSLTGSNAGSTEFNITNDSALATNILIAGEILNPAGSVNIYNIGGGGGDILGLGENAFIQSRNVTLVADSGYVGQGDAWVSLRIPLGFANPGPTLIYGHEGVFLDVNWGGFTAFGELTLDNIVSALGDVDIRVHDAYAPTSFCGCIQLGATKQISGEVTFTNIFAGGEIRLDVGDVTENAGGFAIATDVVIGGAVRAVGDTFIETLSGDITDVAGGLVSGDDIVLEATHGAIGTSGNALDIDLAAGVVDAQAMGSIFLNEVAGDMRIGSIASTLGDVLLVAGGGGIVDGLALGDPDTDVSGRNITLAAGLGIGADGNELEIDSAASGFGTVLAFAGTDIFATETQGDLNLNLAAAVGRVELYAPGGAILDRGPGTNVLGNAAVLIGATGVGEANDALDTQVSRLESASGGGIWIDNTGNLAIGGVSPLVGLTAFGPVDVETKGSLTAEEHVFSLTDVTLHAVDAPAPGQDTAILNGVHVTSADGDILLLAGDDFLLEEAGVVEAAGFVVILGDHLDADPGVGSTMSLRGLVFGAPIFVLGNADNDRIELWQTAEGNPLGLFGQQGDDEILIGHGVEHTVNKVRALVSVTGGPGYDVLRVDDTGDGAGNTGVLTQTRLTGLGMGSADQNQVNPAGGIEYGTVELLDIRLGSGDDKFFARGTLPETHLATGGGNDDILVGNEAQSLDDILGELFVDAQSGKLNYLKVDDSGDPDGDANVVITANAITGLAPAAIHYTAAGGTFGSIYDPATKSFSRGVDILAGTGADHITILGTRATPGTVEVTTVYAGGGDDHVRVLEADPAYLVVRGQAGDDTLDASATTGGAEMYGDADDDRLLGGTGADILIGNQGADYVFGDAGDDILYGDDAAVLRFADYTLCRVEPRNIDTGGDDVVEGGRGNDEMRGGAGDDRYVFAGGFLGDDLIVEKKAGGGSDTLDFGAFAGPARVDLRLTTKQVVNPTHLELTLTECEAIENVLGSQFDDVIDGNGVVNDLFGDGGEDIIHGHGADDLIDGGDGDDELHGDEGGDEIDGGRGNDVILGDIGIVKRLYNADGTRLLNPNGTWRKDVLLLEPGAVVGSRPVRESMAVDAGVLDDELLLLAGVQDSKGKWETRLLSIDLEPAGDDTIRGGDGHDLAFGQRGDDLIYGDGGDDWLEGNEGDDRLYGDFGDQARPKDQREGVDVLIGDSSYHYLPTVDGTPAVAHGYELGRETDADCGEIPARGAMVIPLATVMPAGVHEIAPLGAALYQGTTALAVGQGLPPLKDAAGRTMTVFAAVVPDVARHLDLVAGNDLLRGDGGDDRLIGDHSAVLAPFQANLAGMLGDLEHAATRLADLERLLPPHPTSIVPVASDVLDGGSGDDTLVGDVSLVLVGTAATTGSLPAGLEQAADDFDDAVEQYAKKVKGKPASIGFTTSRDALDGGSGDDRLIGDHSVVVGLVTDGAAGNASTSWMSRVKLPSLVVGGDVDQLAGGVGDDALIGDSSVQILAGVGANPFVALGDGSVIPAGEALAVAADPADGARAVPVIGPGVTAAGIFLPAVQAGAGSGAGFHTVALGRMVDTLTLLGAADTLAGGDDDDTLVGDAQLEIAAFVHGPLATLEPGGTHPDRQLVRVDDLVGKAVLEGAEDRLSGDDGDDRLIGDHAMVVAGLVDGPVLTVGAGEGVKRSKTIQHDEELVHFTGLVGELRASGAFDVLEGGAGDDALVGDHHTLVAGAVLGPVIRGIGAATGFTSEHRFETPVEFSELVGSLELCGGGDALFGGDGDDALVGDSSTHVLGVMAGAAIEGPAAFVAQGAYQHPYREAIVDFDGLVGSIHSTGSPDELYGEAGDDALVGDDQLVIAGIVSGDLLAAGGGTAALPTKKTQDTALVEFDRLVGSVELEGTLDWLHGGDGDDLAVGDHHLVVAAVHTGAVVHGAAALAADIASAHGRLSNEAQVDFDRLVDCITLEGCDDTIAGDGGADHLIGDHQVNILAAVAGPILTGSVADPIGTATPAGQCEALVEFEGLVGNLEVRGARDALEGGTGADLLIGDSQVVIAGIMKGALVAGLPAAAASAMPTAPAPIDLVRFGRLVECISVESGCDTLLGGADDDELTGDNDVEILGIVAGGAGGSLASRFEPRVEFDGLIGDLSLCGANDALNGGDGADCLVGDHSVRIAGVIAGAQPSDGGRVEIGGLAGSVTVRGGDDRLDGGLDDDTLVGDNQTVIAGLIAIAGGSLGGREFEVEGLLCSLRIEGGRDNLLGGSGADTLYGDNATMITGVALGGAPDGGGSTALAFAPSTALPLIEVEQLVGRVDIRGNRDVLDGGDGADALYGDHHTSIAGVAGAPAAGESLRIEIEESMLGCVSISGAQDTIRGGNGDDRAFGDSLTEVTAAAVSVGAGSRLEIEVGGLAGGLEITGGDDQVWGQAGDDALVGDHETLVAGLVLTGGIGGALALDLDGLLGQLELDGGCDQLDGGDGADRLAGDHVTVIGGVLDDAGVPVGPVAGTVAIDIHELIGCMDMDGANDQLTAGAGADQLIGDSRTVVGAYLGSFAAPLAAGIVLTGDTLVDHLDVDAGCDTLRGDADGDVLVGDGDTIVALAAHAAAGPAGSYGMDALVEDLHVGAASDSLNGGTGTNVLEHGNRAVAPRGLVDKSSISSLSKVNPPAAAPAIDWSGGVCDVKVDGRWGGVRGGAGWLGDFVNELGRSAEEQDPNARIRIKL